MKFEEVLPALREGKKIRLKEWKNIEYIYKPKNETGFRTKDNHVVEIGWQDFFSDNWEIVKEKKKVKLRDLTEEQFKKWQQKNCIDGDKCHICIFNKVNCCFSAYCWIKHKDLYSDKFLDQEIEIEEE